jgi:molecular chaperone GrpE
MRWPADPELRRRMVEGLLDWVAGLEQTEPPPEGVSPEPAGEVPDLYSALAALNALKHEVGLQGREFRRVAEAVEKGAEAPAQQVPDPEEERRTGRREVVSRLLEARDRATRVLETARSVEARMAGGWFRAAARREAFASVVSALRMHRDALDEALRELDCREFVAAGSPFDPERMRAVERAGPEEGEPGTVVEVVRSGWLFGEALLRPAEVRVVPEQVQGGRT